MTTTTTAGTTNFVPDQTIHFLVKVFTFLSLFQPPKTFPDVLHYPNLSKRRSEKFFFEQNFFFQKKLFIFFLLFFFNFFEFFFSIFFFFSFFFFELRFWIFFFNFFFCLNFTTRFSILLTKQTKNTLGQNELDQ